MDLESRLFVTLGNIPAEEMRFVLSNLPGRLLDSEVQQMINTVDRNKDGRIRNKSYLKYSSSLYFSFKEG